MTSAVAARTPARQDSPSDVLSRGERQVSVALAVAVVTMPILTPVGPGNTALADVTMAVAIVLTTVWLRRSRAKVGLPYLVGMGLLMVAGAVAAVRANIAYTGITVVQDVFCLLWAAAIANAVRISPRVLSTFLRSWVWSGVAWAAVLCTGKVAGISWMAGTSLSEGGRAALTFNDPNLAGNYFLCALALVIATRVPRRWWARSLAMAVILLAVVFTGSNGAVTGLVLLLGVGVVLWVRTHHGIAGALAMLLLSVAAVGAVAPVVSVTQIRQQAADSIQVLRDSIGRSYESSWSREQLFSEGMHLYFTGDLVGVGPGRTKATLKEAAAPYVKEAHNDYVATIVERGVVGGLGLVLLLAGIALRLGRMVRWPQPETVRALLPRPEFLVGLACAFALAGVFYEVLHFRHLWALLGLVAGIDPGWRPSRRAGERTAGTVTRSPDAG